MQKTILEVPYSERNDAKKLGAKWDSEIRTWYVPKGQDLLKFDRWLGSESQSGSIAVNQNPVQPDNSSFLRVVDNKDYENKHETISSVLGKVKRILNGEFRHEFWLVADIAKISKAKSGTYIDLVEYDDNKRELAKIKAVVWNANSKVLDFFQRETKEELRAGLSVLTKVKLTFHEKYGMQVTISQIDPTFSIGKAELKRRAIKEELKKSNLTDKNKQFLPISIFKKIAVISPKNAAALGDFRREADLLEKYGFVNFDYFTATFQGDIAPREICQSFTEVEEKLKTIEYDCIVFIRGGGAESDLESINDIDITKSVANASIPVLVGIGHEVNKMIVDEIAFKSFDTPSKVVAFILSNITENVNNIVSIKSAIKVNFDIKLQKIRTNVDSHRARLNSNIVNLNTKFKKIKSDVEFHRDRVKSSVDHLESKITKIKSDLGLNKKRIGLITSSLNDKRQATAQKNNMTKVIVALVIIIIAIVIYFTNT